MKKLNRCQKVNFIVFVFLFLFLFSGVFSVSWALDPDKKITQYNVRTWNMEAGLPGNSVFALQQTQDGFLWIGTQDGLVRFDGVDFKLYNKREFRQLMSNDIRALYQDRDGTLWIGTSSGGLTRYKEGRFTTYPITRYKSLYRISTINRDRWGNLWIGSFAEGLTCISPDELRFTTYTTKQGLPHNQVSFMYQDANGDLWVTTAAGIIKLLKPGAFQNYGHQEVLPYYKTVSIYRNDTKELLIGSGNGLFRSQKPMLNTFEKEPGVPHPIITYLYEDRMKNLWVGTDGGGLTRTGKREPGTPTGVERLNCGSVTAIYEDREGSLWVGTLDDGLHQLRDGKFTTLTTREGLVHDYIRCTYEDRAGYLWMGTQGGLNRLNLKTGKLTAPSMAGLSNNAVFCLFENSAGSLLIGTHKGLHRYKNGKSSHLTKKHGLSGNKITCISEDQKGNTWIGTENGLNRFDNNGTITVFTKEQGLVSNFIQIIYEDRQGQLWIGTDAGLHILKNGIITVFNLAPGMENNIVRCAYEDNEETLWFGTDGGLIRVKNNNSTLYTVEEGLVENYVYSVLEDEKGYLWLGGRNGISQVSKKELEDVTRGKIHEVQPIRFNEKDGMKSRWCTGAACKTRDGRFWFPTSVGAAMIDPNQIKTNDLAPSVIIKKLIIDGENFTIKSFSGGCAQSAMRHALPPLAAGGRIKIPPGKKRLEFYYTAVSFVNPGKIQFKIKLEGYDSDWVEMGTSRSTAYTALSPGNYTFKVIACNHDGVWNEQGASFSFYMKPHWYKTWLAYSFYALIILLGVFFGVKWRYWKMEKEKKRLAQMVKERTMEISEKNVQLYEQSEKLKEMDNAKSRFFANISHEFRTPLTLIMGPLEQILSDHPDKKIKATAMMMLRNSRRLLHLVNQLLELAHLDSGKMKLETSLQNIVPFVQYIVICFESLALQNKIELNFQKEEDEILVFFDPQKLEQIIFNLLFNAFKFTPEQGRITVRLRQAVGIVGFPYGCIEISVHDTGSGIPRDQLPYIFDRFFSPGESQSVNQKGSGIGLALTRELVKLHYGEIDVHSREGKDSGTQFIVRLSLGKVHLKPGEIVKPSRVEAGPGRSPGTPVLYMNDQKEYAAETHRDKNEKRAAKSHQDVAAPHVREKEVILVVEDNRDVRQYIRGALESRYLIKEAEDGGQGIKKAKEIIPDLIISDIMMPGMDGYQLCQALKNDIDTSHIPIILLSAKASEASVVQGLETGADDYIIKPFSTTILCARIKNLIDLRRQLQQTLKREMEFRPAKMSISQLDKEFLQELQAVIEKNLSHPEFNVEELRKKLYISGATLYRKVSALTGESPTDFIRSYRLNRAALLLKQGFGSITEVAFEVGFNSRTYFSKCFKEKFHQLPSDYQAS